MKFPELRARLAGFAGHPDRKSARPNAVYFHVYDRGSTVPWDGTWNIDIVGGQYHLGFTERGVFELRHVFETEDACCDWLFDHLTTPRPATPVPKAQLDAATSRMHARIVRERAAREKAEDSSQGGLNNDA
ncbi:MAG: hypothetical protein ACT4PP_02965 [Sporichthyaceae bacterium]